MREEKNRQGAVSVSPKKSTGRSLPPLAVAPQYCRECGGRLVRVGYCFTCIACGWGGCS